MQRPKVGAGRRGVEAVGEKRGPKAEGITALWPQGQAHQLLRGGGERRGLGVRGPRSGQEGPEASAWGARSIGEGRGGGGRGSAQGEVARVGGGLRSLRATLLAGEARGRVLVAP